MAKVTKGGIYQDIAILTTMWGAGNPALFDVAKAHEKALLALLKGLVQRAAMSDLQLLVKSTGYGKADAAYAEAIEEINELRRSR